MNIAILIRTLGGGGAERVAQILGDYYVEQGNNVYYFLGESAIQQAYSVKGQIVQTGIKRCLANNKLGNVQVLAKLVLGSYQMRKYKKKYKIDVAISFMEEFNYINILSRGKERVITRICTILSEEGEWVNFLFRKSLVHFFYPKADRVVVMSDYAKEDMFKNYAVPMRKMIKIPNPVLQADVRDSDEIWQYGEKVIVTVGRLAAEKQQERMIKAFSYVHAYEPEAVLLILGVGPKEGYLKNIARRCKVDQKVKFAGFQKDVAYYLQRSRLFVLSSRLEGFPNAMIEAMANGLPVITIDSPGGCREIVGKKNEAGECREIEYCPYGILTPRFKGDIQIGAELDQEERLLGQAMLRLVQDDQLRAKYSARARKRAAMYNRENIMEKWNRLIGI